MWLHPAFHSEQRAWEFYFAERVQLVYLTVNMYDNNKTKSSKIRKSKLFT